jgi:hypothetical protein
MLKMEPYAEMLRARAFIAERPHLTANQLQQVVSGDRPPPKDIPVACYLCVLRAKGIKS